MSRLTELYNGFRDSLVFSNWKSLVIQRLFCRHERFVSYLWQNRWWVLCDQSHLDNNGPKEIFAEKIYHQSIQLSAKNDKISYVNVGGNIGVFDIVVASLINTVTRAITFELNPRTATRLRFNLQANQLNHIDIREIGIAGQAATVKLNDTGCAYSFTLYNPSTQENGIECQVQPLSTALAQEFEQGIEWDLLKLDCEGAEYEILALTKPEHLRLFRHIVMEVHPPPPGHTLDDISQALTKANFVKIPITQPIHSTLEFWQRN